MRFLDTKNRILTIRNLALTQNTRFDTAYIIGQLANKSPYRRLCGCDRYCWHWTSAPYISLRSGMFKHLKVIPITAAKRASKDKATSFL